MNVQSLVKPFEDIPEAKGLPVIGTLLDYTPIKGFKVEYMYRLYQKRHARYGDIYKERLPAIPGNYQVVIRSKEDTEAMFRNEGPMPGRSVLEHMQQLKIQFGKTDSIINLNGLDWQRVSAPCSFVQYSTVLFHCHLILVEIMY